MSSKFEVHDKRDRTLGLLAETCITSQFDLLLRVPIDSKLKHATRERSNMKSVAIPRVGLSVGLQGRHQR